MSDYAEDVEPTGNGYIVAGMSGGEGVLLKVDNNGARQWVRPYPFLDIVNAVKPISGGYVACGDITVFGTNKNGVLFKVEADGDTVWTVEHGIEPTTEVFNDLIVVTDGYVVIGTIQVGYNFCIQVLKFDLNGDLVWNEQYGDTTGAGWSICATSDGGYVLGGYIGSMFSGQHSSSYIIKIDSVGNVEWDTIINDNPVDEDSFCLAVIEADDDSIVVTGKCGEIFVDPCYDIYLAKLSPDDGVVQWFAKYGGVHMDNAKDVVQDIDGGYIIAGCSQSPSGHMLDPVLIKTNSAGTLQWVWTQGMANSNIFKSVCLGNNGGYVAVGHTQETYGDYDVYIVCLGEESDHIDRESFSFDISPNPCNPTAQLYQLSADAEIAVYDVKGSRVDAVHQGVFDGSLLPSGVYFIQVESGGMVATQKLVLLK